MDFRWDRELLEFVLTDLGKDGWDDDAITAARQLLALSDDTPSAYLAIGKFADHLPLYRQNGIFEREGVEIPRATQTSWVLQTYEAIQPLGDELKKALKAD